MLLLKKKSKTPLALNLNSDELDCKCSGIDCTLTLVHPNLAETFQRVRDLLGDPIRINSGFRCQRHNWAVGGVRASSHLRGAGVDLAPRNPQLIDRLEVIMRQHFDVIIRYRSWVHGHLYMEGYDGQSKVSRSSGKFGD